jgi:1-acyl-sn-glycerol-3-phosphate acyltransferase
MARHSGRIRVWLLLMVGLVLMSATALLMTALAVATAFRARRLYAAIAARLARVILWTWGVRLTVHADRPFPVTQTVYISNHTSTLDLFMLVALGLPNTRFFLSGFLRKYIPLGVIATLMGTFFTVPQTRPGRRREIFQRADRILRRTRESVYLSPEGGRITTGEIGHFNKGAFHLATSLRAPIVPMYLHIPADMDPGLGYRASPGTVHVYVRPPIDTSAWRVEDLAANVAGVRAMFVEWHQQFRDPERRMAAHVPTPVPVAC